MRNVDVAIMGAGPAGLAAAVRVRWVKTYRAVPCSVCVFDPASPGGLTRFRSTRLTGPGWQLDAADILAKLMGDMRALNVTIEPTLVDRVTQDNGRWSVFGSGRVLCAARAVVLATGLRALANEADFFGRGLSLTYNGYDFLAPQLAELTNAPEGTRLILVGNAKTVNLLPVLDTLTQPGVHITLVLDEGPSEALRAAFGSWHTVFGRVVEVCGENTVREVVIVDPAGKKATLACDRVYIDYAAFEIRPQASVALDGLVRDANGFIRIDRDGATNLPGVFAAGDATGLYAMALKALSEGAVAGLSAYRYVFGQKFGFPAPIFAYAAQDAAIDPTRCDYPELLGDDVIEPLGTKADMETCLATQGLEGMAGRLNAAITYGEVCDLLDASAARTLIHALLDAKIVTLQPHKEHRGARASRT